MELKGPMGGFYKVSLIVSRMAFINLLWILFTILGMGIFGIVPATVGLFSVVRKWVMKETDVPIFKTFWDNYRKEFLKSNLLGLILLIIGYILYIDFIYLPFGGFYTIIRVVLVTVTIFYGTVLLYIFPVYVHYNWKIRSYITYSLLLGIGHPHFTFLMILAIGGLYYICYSFPGIIPFFSISVLGYILMWISFAVIRKLENIHHSQSENNME